MKIHHYHFRPEADGSCMYENILQVCFIHIKGLCSPIPKFLLVYHACPWQHASITTQQYCHGPPLCTCRMAHILPRCDYILSRHSASLSRTSRLWVTPCAGSRALPVHNTTQRSSPRRSLHVGDNRWLQHQSTRIRWIQIGQATEVTAIPVGVPQKKHFVLNTYKSHTLGHTPAIIREVGLLDMSSTQCVYNSQFLYFLQAYSHCIQQGKHEHCHIKKFFPYTNKKNYAKQIVQHQWQEHHLHQACKQYHKTQHTIKSSPWPDISTQCGGPLPPTRSSITKYPIPSGWLAVLLEQHTRLDFVVRNATDLAMWACTPSYC